ncbi:MAG: hypothetical protein QW291_07120 [Thermofilaceae archaeon]
MTISGKILTQPPRIKVLEALGSIADGRVRLIDSDRASVESSTGERAYTVYVNMEKGVAFSDDNGTKFRGYIGYPIIAVLMLKGVLPFDERLAKALTGIPWKELNEQYKRYAIVEELVKREAEKRGAIPKEVDSFVKRVMDRLSQIQLRYMPAPEA